MDDPHFLEVVAGLTERFAAANIDLLIASARPEDELKTYERLLQGRRVDGFIVPHTRVEAPRIDYLKEIRATFVAYGRTGAPQDYAWFDFDNEAGTVLVVERLVGLGHRQLAYIHAPLDLTFAWQRHQGFRRGLREADLDAARQQIVAAGFGRRGGYEAMQSLLAQKVRPSAIVVDNQPCGVGWCAACWMPAWCWAATSPSSSTTVRRPTRSSAPCR